MPSCQKPLIFLGGLLFSSILSASSLSSNLTTLIEETLPHSHIGMLIQDAQTGEVFFEHHAQDYFYPASVTKLFLTDMALGQLGPDWRFETALYPISQDLVITFSGDPSFQTEDYAAWWENLSQQGVTDIWGDIVIDTAATAGQDTANLMAADLPWYFAAPRGAIIIDENAFSLDIQGSETIGELATIAYTDPQPWLPALSSNVISLSEYDTEHLCQLDIEMSPEHLHIGGCWPVGSSQSLKLANQYPFEFLQRLTSHQLSAYGISHHGAFRLGYLPENHGEPLQISHSPVLSELLRVVNHDSNNIYADAILKATARTAYNQPGSFILGATALNQWFEKKSSLPGTLQLVDGSGASRYNLIQPLQVSQLLSFSDLSPYLPTMGLSGNLKRRAPFTHATFTGKTGTATGVSALSGYLHLPSQRTLIVVIIINNAMASYQTLKHFEDDCLSLIERSFS